MDDDFSIQILNHLLGRSSRRDTRAIEQQLERNEVAAATYKSCADAVAAHASSAARPVMVSKAARDRMLGEVLGEVSRRPRRGNRWRLKTWGWPAAAAILLILNLAQWFGAASFTKTGQGLKLRPISIAAGNLSPDRPESSRDSAFETSVEKLGTPPPLDRDTENKLRTLRREYAALAARSRLDERKKEQLVQQMVGAMTPESDGRLSAIMLVDSATYNSKRTTPPPLVLSAPGIVGATAPLATTFSVAPASNPASVELPAQTVAVTGPLNIPLSSASVTASTGSVEAIMTTAAASSEPSIAPISPNPVAPAASSPIASAYSIFDPALGQGFLDMYNMPVPPAGSGLELWVEPQGTEGFVPVGQIPAEYYGTSGGIYYKLPIENSVPAKILITVESNSATTTAAPSSNTVVQGP